jgi:hypothetical protein
MKRLTGILWLLPTLAALAGCPSGGSVPLGTTVPFPAPNPNDPNGPQYWLEGEYIGTTISGPAVSSVTSGSPPAAGVVANAANLFVVIATGGDPIVGVKQLQLYATISVCNANGGGGSQPTKTWATVNSTVGTPTSYQTVLALQFTPNIIQDMGAFNEVDYKISSTVTTPYSNTVNSQPLYYRFVRPGMQAHGCPQ